MRWLVVLVVCLTTAGVQAQREVPMEIGGARLTVAFEGREVSTVQRRRLLAWVERSARTIHRYWGRFPVRTLRVEVVVGRGSGVGFGQHFRGRRVRVRVGRHADDEELRRDWVLPHEMAHLAFPMLARRHRWMREGLSTYLESILLAQEGRIRPEDVWRRFVRRMPNGRPSARDGGLDDSPGWGRLYWGGALFWMVVDVRLREETGGRVTLRTVLRGILAQGGNARRRWTTAEVVRVGDRISGTQVFARTYRELAERPGDVDLDRFFGRLGVRETPGGVAFDDDAPRAAIRAAITR